MTAAQKRAATIARNKASKARIEQAQAETRAIVAAGVCPSCGSKVVRNLALTGWWQCEQYGAETHRARPSEPSCSWQGFTHG